MCLVTKTGTAALPPCRHGSRAAVDCRWHSAVPGGHVPRNGFPCPASRYSVPCILAMTTCLDSRRYLLVYLRADVDERVLTVEHEAVGVSYMPLYLLGDAYAVYDVCVDAAVFDGVTAGDDVRWHVLGEAAA